MKKTLLILLAILFTAILGSHVVKAIGTLTPSGTVGDATQYTLNDIYTKLTTGTGTSTKSGSISVPSSVTATFRTLTELYNAIPAVLSLSNSTTTVPVGINLATTTLTTIDSDLTAANIANGVNVFGVIGTMQAGVVYPTQWSTDYSSGHTDWATAVSYCNNLTQNTYSDWRLPTYIELVNAYLTGTAGFQGDYYWSNTAWPTLTDYAYTVNMNNGLSFFDDKTITTYRARCAR